MRSILFLVIACVVSSGCSAANEPITSSTEPVPLPRVHLASDGLGDVLLGLPPDVVVAEISAIFGEPDHDSDWIPSEPNRYGTCPGERMRAVGWGSLVSIFVDEGDTELGGWFYTYTYGYDYSENTGGVDPRGLGLTTAEGIGLGSAVADLVRVFDSGVVIDGDIDLDVWSFEIPESGLRGLLSGAGEDDTVTLIELATGCS